MHERIPVPERDPRRPGDDPWDADAVRYVEQFTARPRGWLMEFGRGQTRLDANTVAVAQRIFEAAGVRVVAEPRGKGSINRFYRTDPDAPLYPSSAAHRRWLLRGK